MEARCRWPSSNPISPFRIEFSCGKPFGDRNPLTVAGKIYNKGLARMVSPKYGTDWYGCKQIKLMAGVDDETEKRGANYYYRGWIRYSQTTQKWKAVHGLHKGRSRNIEWYGQTPNKCETYTDTYLIYSLSAHEFCASLQKQSWLISVMSLHALDDECGIIANLLPVYNFLLRINNCNKSP